MIKSMTGFGKATVIFKGGSITVEIKSVNSKQMDLHMRVPAHFKSKELELRSIAGKDIERGRAEISINLEQEKAESEYVVNEHQLRFYHRELKRIAKDLKIDEGDLMERLLQMPDVITHVTRDVDVKEWKRTLEAYRNAFKDFDQFRIREGRHLEADMEKRARHILAALQKVEGLDGKRIGRVRSRIRENLMEVVQKIDKARLEQELIYYVEKLDITEEKVRLKTHCDYFLKTLKSPNAEGKKLGFITQEMGREINTIGSKANDAAIQKLVVEMKDELEKIKEQSFNIL